MKKYFSLILCVLIIALSCICAYAQQGHSQEYADAVIEKIESIQQAEFYCDGYSYFTDINNDGTDEVILMHHEGLPYYISVNSYAPQYDFSENGICSVEALCNVYSHSGDVCVGDISVYKYDDTMVIKDTTFIVNGLPNGEPSPTKTALYKKYKIGQKGEIILVSEASWSYYEESNQYYVKRGSDPEQGKSPSTKDEAGKIIDEYEKGVYTLLYTVDFMSGEGVVYNNNVLTFEKTVKKVNFEVVQEVPEESSAEETSKGAPSGEKIPANDNHEATGVESGILYVLLIVAIVLAIIIVAIILVIFIRRGSGKSTQKK